MILLVSGDTFRCIMCSCMLLRYIRRFAREHLVPFHVDRKSITVINLELLSAYDFVQAPKTAFVFLQFKKSLINISTVYYCNERLSATTR